MNWEEFDLQFGKLLDRPIAFHRIFVDIAGSVTAALMLSQALYWANRTTDPDGWFYKTRDEWNAETGLRRNEQERARENLRCTPFWKEELRGLPAKLYFRVDLSELRKVILGGSDPVTLEEVLEQCKATLIGISKSSYMRAKRAGVEAEYVNYAEVLKAKGMVCGICGETILRPIGLKATYLSFDHIKPVSKGGGHIFSNIQPTHAGCNLGKGDDDPSDISVTDVASQLAYPKPTRGPSQNQQDSLPKTDHQAYAKPACNKETEITSENTTEITACARSAAQTSPAAPSLKFPKSFADPHWKAYFESKPIYAGIDLDFEREQMEVWCEGHNAHPSTRRFANWLKKCAEDLKAQSVPLSRAELVIVEVCALELPLTATQRRAVKTCSDYLREHKATTGQLRQFARYHHRWHRPGEPERDPPRPEQVCEKWSAFLVWLKSNPQPLAVGEIKKVCETCHGRKRVFSTPGDIDSPKVPCPACQGNEAKTKTEPHGDQLVA